MSRTAAGARSAAVGRGSGAHVEAVGGRAASNPTITNNVTYDTTTTGQPYQLNAYEPEIAALATIIHVHGGGWTSVTSGGLGQTKDEASIVKIDKWLAARGFLVLSIDYRLIPVASGNEDTSYRDDMIAGVRRAVAWARANADDYNGPTDKIVLLGESAGGHLVLMSTILGDRPDACIAWSTFTRLDQYGNSTTIKNYLGITTDPSGAGAATAQLYSPYNQWVDGIDVPVRMATFTDDLSSVREADQDDLAGVIEGFTGEVVTATVSGSGHADFTGTAEFDNACAWIREVL